MARICCKQQRNRFLAGKNDFSSANWRYPTVKNRCTAWKTRYPAAETVAGSRIIVTATEKAAAPVGTAVICGSPATGARHSGQSGAGLRGRGLRPA